MIQKEKRNHSFTKAKDGPTLIDPWSLFHFFKDVGSKVFLYVVLCI